MSRKTTSIKAGVLVAALAGTALGVVPASAAGPTITSVGPVKVSSTGAATITIKGTGFDSTVKSVAFSTNGSTYSCQGPAVVVNDKLLYVEKPAHASNCAVGQQQVHLHSAATATSNDLIGSAFNPADPKKTVTFAAPAIITSGASNTTASGPLRGGQTIKVTATGLPAVPAKVAATLGGKPLTNIKRVSNTVLTATTPAGTSVGNASLVVSADGVSSAPLTFTYERTIDIKPASLPVGDVTTSPGKVTISGLGLKPASSAKVFLDFCGKLVNDSVIEPATWTDKRIVVTVPRADDSLISATAGKACDVKVVVDTLGDTGISSNAFTDATDDVVSVLTGGSTFTYSKY